MHDPSAGEDEEAYTDYTYAEESEEEEAAERDSERSPSIVRPGPVVQAAFRAAAKQRAKAAPPPAVRPRGSVVTFVPAVAPRAKKKPKPPGPADGGGVVRPLEAEENMLASIYVEAATKLRFMCASALWQTSMSGYTEEFDQQLVERLQEETDLPVIPTREQRQDAVADILKEWGVQPTEAPGGQLHR